MRALRRKPAPPSLQCVQVPAPVGGLNTIAGAADMPPGDCLQMYNMVSGELGTRARLGYRLWATGAGDGLGTMASIRTVMPYTGSDASGADDQIFVAHRFGIQAMASGSVTAMSIVFSASDAAKPNIGRGIFTTFTTAAGAFLLYCDEEAGYHVFSEATGSWVKVVEDVAGDAVSGVDPANFCFVMTWKSRVWFVEKNSTNVWYLPAGQIYGAATKLAVGVAAQFRRGGDVIGLWSWTLDGGIGIDDHLVIAARGGDVAIYKGTDPASVDTFGIKGTWNAGAFVAGRRVAIDFGGDLLLLTKSGIRPLSQLVQGQDGNQTYATAKVANLFNALALQRSELPGWDMCINPEENALIVTVPDTGNSGFGDYNTQQLAQSLWNRSWSRFRDLPISAMAAWKGQLYFGDANETGYLWVSDGYMDADLTAITQGEGSPVQWSCLTPFNNGDGRQKQVELIRPTVLAEAYPPTISVAPRYNLDLSELASLTEVAGTTGSLFDVGKWDSAVWGDGPSPSQYLRNGGGVGSSVAIAIRGTSRSRTTLVSLEVFLKEGGFL